MMMKEKEGKYVFIKNLEMALLFDHERSGLEGIDYIYSDEYDDEYIIITYKGGHEVTILATANSNGANAKEIIKEIYK